jgi:hypothetical protein
VSFAQITDFIGDPGRIATALTNQTNFCPTSPNCPTARQRLSRKLSNFEREERSMRTIKFEQREAELLEDGGFAVADDGTAEIRGNMTVIAYRRFGDDDLRLEIDLPNGRLLLAITRKIAAPVIG